MFTTRVTPTTISHAIAAHHHIWQASSLFHTIGNSYEERQVNDIEGRLLHGISTSLEVLCILVPSLARPQLPFDRHQLAFQEAGGGILRGNVLTALEVAHSVVNRHWADTIAAASAAMQTSLEKLTSSMTPSWKENLHPSANWQLLINSCSGFLSNTDSKAMMAMINQTEQAR